MTLSIGFHSCYGQTRYKTEFNSIFTQTNILVVSCMRSNALAFVVKVQGEVIWLCHNPLL